MMRLPSGLGVSLITKRALNLESGIHASRHGAKRYLLLPWHTLCSGGSALLNSRTNTTITFGSEPPTGVCSPSSGRRISGYRCMVFGAQGWRPGFCLYLWSFPRQLVASGFPKDAAECGRLDLWMRGSLGWDRECVVPAPKSGDFSRRSAPRSPLERHDPGPDARNGIGFQVSG